MGGEERDVGMDRHGSAWDERQMGIVLSEGGGRQHGWHSSAWFSMVGIA